MELSYDGVCFDLFGTLVDSNGVAVAGAADALRRLPPLRWAIVTSCGRRFAQTLIASAALPMPVVLISGDDVARGKPAPDPYRAGAHALGLDVSKVLAVEDSHAGIEAARAAGIDVVAILAGRGLAFAQRASFQVERFSDIAWTQNDDGSIRCRIEP